MYRRDFLRAATGGAGVVGVTGAAQATGPSVAANVAANNTTTTGNGPGNQTGNQTTTGGTGGGTVTVPLVSNPYKFEGATDSPLYIRPGTTVKFVWKSDTHNIVVESQPEGANWSGVEQVYNSGHTHEHTFMTAGTYEFYCEPHRSLGMTGTIVVNESGQPPGASSGGGGRVTLSPHEMGVPFQAQYVGLATLLAMFVTLVFTFFTLKYGGSPHASAPNKRE